jgi:uncharacterized protein (DUF1778 family)
MNHGGGEPSPASLIERSAELKRTLVDFALSAAVQTASGAVHARGRRSISVIGARLSELVRR